MGKFFLFKSRKGDISAGLESLLSFLFLPLIAINFTQFIVPSHTADDFYINLIENEVDVGSGYAVYEFRNLLTKDITVDSTIFRTRIEEQPDATPTESLKHFVWENNGWKEFSSYTFKAGKTYRIKIVGMWKPKLGLNSREWVPAITIDGKTYEQIRWDWWNSSWSTKIPVNVSSTINTDRNYTVPINITFRNGMNNNFSDVRWINGTEERELFFYLEEKVDGSWALFWVKVDDNITNSGYRIWAYYGNSEATADRSDGGNAFELFDNVEHNTTSGITNFGLIAMCCGADNIDTTSDAFEGNVAYRVVDNDNTSNPTGERGSSYNYSRKFSNKFRVVLRAKISEDAYLDNYINYVGIFVNAYNDNQTVYFRLTDSDVALWNVVNGVNSIRYTLFNQSPIANSWYRLELARHDEAYRLEIRNSTFNQTNNSVQNTHDPGDYVGFIIESGPDNTDDLFVDLIFATKFIFPGPTVSFGIPEGNNFTGNQSVRKLFYSGQSGNQLNLTIKDQFGSPQNTSDITTRIFFKNESEGWENYQTINGVTYDRLGNGLHIAEFTVNFSLGEYSTNTTIGLTNNVSNSFNVTYEPFHTFLNDLCIGCLS